MIEKLAFKTEDGEVLELYVEEETRIAGTSYLLVTDSDGDEATAYILKDLSEDGESEACYVMVDDENELDAVYRIFEQLMEETFERT